MHGVIADQPLILTHPIPIRGIDFGLLPLLQFFFAFFLVDLRTKQKVQMDNPKKYKYERVSDQRKA